MKDFLVQVCHNCGASKTGLMNFTNLDEAAPWRSNIWQSEEPWDTPPAVAQLCCFNCKKTSYDILHVWHLGVARDLWLRRFQCPLFLWP